MEKLLSKLLNKNKKKAFIMFQECISGRENNIHIQCLFID